MQEIFQGFSNFIYFFLNGPFYMLFEQSIVKLCAIFAVFVKVRIVLRKQYFFVRYKTPSAFFLQTEFWYYPTDCINMPVLLVASESVPAFLNSRVEDASFTVKTVFPLSVPVLVCVEVV